MFNTHYDPHKALESTMKLPSCLNFWDLVKFQKILLWDNPDILERQGGTFHANGCFLKKVFPF